MADERDGGEASGLSQVMERNIRSMLEARAEHEGRRSRDERVADAITAFAGSMGCVYLHMILFGGWIVVNLDIVPGIRPFDPFPFVMLAMFASVEAIFLSTFVLISQNRMTAEADRRADLDLQVNLLAEHEITRLVQMCDAISRRLGVESQATEHLEELKRDVHPVTVLGEIERAAEDRKGNASSASPGDPPRGSSESA